MNPDHIQNYLHDIDKTLILFDDDNWFDSVWEGRVVALSLALVESKAHWQQFKDNLSQKSVQNKTKDCYSRYAGWLDILEQYTIESGLIPENELRTTSQAIFSELMEESEEGHNHENHHQDL